MKRIPLTQGKFALVDDEVFDKLSQVKWTAYYNRGRWYAFRSIEGTSGQEHETLHHQILPKKKGWDVDHWDGDGLNCQRHNLRYLSRTGNNANQRKRPGLSSRFKGVTWDKNAVCWRAQIQAHYTHYTLGLFESELDAAAAYDKAAKKFFGPAARVNFC